MSAQSDFAANLTAALSGLPGKRSGITAPPVKPPAGPSTAQPYQPPGAAPLPHERRVPHEPQYRSAPLASGHERRTYQKPTEPTRERERPRSVPVAAYDQVGRKRRGGDLSGPDMKRRRPGQPTQRPLSVPPPIPLLDEKDIPMDVPLLEEKDAESKVFRVDKQLSWWKDHFLPTRDKYKTQKTESRDPPPNPHAAAHLQPVQQQIQADLHRNACAAADIPPVSLEVPKQNQNGRLSHSLSPRSNPPAVHGASLSPRALTADANCKFKPVDPHAGHAQDLNVAPRRAHEPHTKTEPLDGLPLSRAPGRASPCRSIPSSSPQISPPATELRDPRPVPRGPDHIPPEHIIPRGPDPIKNQANGSMNGMLSVMSRSQSLTPGHSQQSFSPALPPDYAPLNSADLENIEDHIDLVFESPQVAFMNTDEWRGRRIDYKTLLRSSPTDIDLFDRIFVDEMRKVDDFYRQDLWRKLRQLGPAIVMAGSPKTTLDQTMIQHLQRLQIFADANAKAFIKILNPRCLYSPRAQTLMRKLMTVKFYGDTVPKRVLEFYGTIVEDFPIIPETSLGHASRISVPSVPPRHVPMADQESETPYFSSHASRLQIDQSGLTVDDRAMAATLKAFRRATQLSTLSIKSYAPRKPKKYRGVRRTPSGKYVARIEHDGKAVHLGTFSTGIAAAKKYDMESMRLKGDRAITNFEWNAPEEVACVPMMMMPSGPPTAPDPGDVYPATNRAALPATIQPAADEKNLQY